MLDQVLRSYSAISVLPYERFAASEFDRFRTGGVRIGTMDLRIAAIAMVHKLTVVSRNIGDFSNVPGLQVEDWTH